MFVQIVLGVLLLETRTGVSTSVASDENEMETFPLVMVVLLARNKAHTLPVFLTYFNHLTYPKNRLALHIRADHSEDQTIDTLEDWLQEYRQKYHSVDEKLERGQSQFQNELEREKFGVAHMKHVIELKENALVVAETISADFVWFLDVDVFLTYNNTLIKLTQKKYPIVSPVLSSLHKYSNFMTNLDDEEDEKYNTILGREELGCFKVPSVSECILIDTRKPGTSGLTFRPSNEESYNGAYQDLVEFIYAAKAFGLPFHVCNDELYGYVMPELLTGETLLDEKSTLRDLKVHMIMDDVNIQVDDILQKHAEFPPVNGKLGLDEIYCLNLRRRGDRHRKMAQMFKVIGVDYRRLEAVDGRDLNSTVLTGLGVFPVPGYHDIMVGRPMTFGEVGCTLAHYAVWEDTLRNGYDEVLVVEDDIYFLPDFTTNVQKLRKEITNLHLEWDLIYLDRQNLSGKSEPKVFNSTMLVEPGFSYLTTGYLLSRSGAEKLIAGDPLKKLLPVDEYLPIMYDQPYMLSVHQNPHLELFPVRDLKAFAVVPGLLEQIHDHESPGYVSDTETSSFVEVDAPSSTSRSVAEGHSQEGPASLHSLQTETRCWKSALTCLKSESPLSPRAYPSLFHYHNRTRV